MAFRPDSVPARILDVNHRSKPDILNDRYLKSPEIYNITLGVQLATVAKKQIVVDTRTSIAGLDAASGSVLISRDVPNYRGINVLTHMAEKRNPKRFGRTKPKVTCPRQW